MQNIQKSPLERDLEWYQNGLKQHMEENIKIGIEAGLPFESIPSIKTINKEQVNKTLNLFQQIKLHLQENSGSFELAEKLVDYIYSDKSEICVRNRAICFFSKKCMNNDIKIEHHIALYQLDSYMKQFPNLVKWGATLNYYPEHVKVLQEMGLQRTKILYVTQEMANFMDVCMKKINDTFREVLPNLILRSESGVTLKEKEILVFIKGNQNEKELYEKSEKYRNIATFFIDEIEQRINQEIAAHAETSESGEFTFEKIDKFVVGYFVSLNIELLLKEKHKIEHEPFTSVVRKALYDLCGSLNSKESGTSSKKSWRLLEEYDKAFN